MNQKNSNAWFGRFTCGYWGGGILKKANLTGPGALHRFKAGELKVEIYEDRGENGHLAFNDPGEADFEDRLDVKVVHLDPMCRQQQASEGWFGSLDEVPRTAITVTIPALFRVPRLILTVLGPRKAQAVKDMIQGLSPPVVLHRFCGGIRGLRFIWIGRVRGTLAINLHLQFVINSRANLFEAHCRAFFQVVLPYAYNTPSHLPQFSGGRTISLFVSCYLPEPIRCIRFRYQLAT